MYEPYYFGVIGPGFLNQVPYIRLYSLALERAFTRKAEGSQAATLRPWPNPDEELRYARSFGGAMAAEAEQPRALWFLGGVITGPRQ